MDSGGRILKYETLCTVGDKVTGGAGRCMYVHGMTCMCGIYLLSKHRLPWSLLRCQPPSPRAGNKCRYGHNELHSAMQSGQPTITETQRQRDRDRIRSGQGHTEEDGHGAGRQGTVGPVRVG